MMKRTEAQIVSWNEIKYANFTLGAIFFVFNISLHAQKVLPKEQEQVIADSLALETRDFLLELEQEEEILEQPTYPEPVVRILQDNPEMAAIDELWLKEMINGFHYDLLQQTIEESATDTLAVEYPELSTDVLKQRLAELNSHTPFHIEYNPTLEQVIKNFLKNKREFLGRMIEKSQYYFPMFEEILDRHDIPLEIKYLAVVESALNPRAKSRVGATGLWQFMYSTGQMYGLNVNSYVDERSEPLKSTDAASRYLSSLYKVFGDWDLALAAYNSGPGNVTKAIRRSGGYQNYWNLRPFLPRETAGYVPSFYAILYIFEYAEEHGFKPKSFDKPYFLSDTVKVKQMITFDQVSEVSGISVEELQFYNPSYKLDIIPHIKDRNYALRLPRKKVGLWVQHEDSIYAFAKADLDKREKPLPQLFEMDKKVVYKVRSGDYLGLIARKYSVRVSDIKRWNGLRNNNIHIGQRLTIYPSKPYNEPPAKNSGTTIGESYYIVKNGDSLWSIAERLPGVSVQDLKEWNNLKSDNVTPGLRLKVTKG